MRGAASPVGGTPQPSAPAPPGTTPLYSVATFLSRVDAPTYRMADTPAGRQAVAVTSEPAPPPRSERAVAC